MMDILHFLYETLPGRLLLKPLASRPVSDLAGRILDSRISMLLIAPFVKRSGICCDDYDLSDIHSFNDFFRRPIRPGMRPSDPDPRHLIAPCDGLLRIYPIKEDLVLPVKQSSYRITDLLRSRRLARRFDGGWCFVFRLRVDHYHRFIYPVSGRKSPVARIPGFYHTVQPAALSSRPVFCENTRTWTLIRSHYGTLLQMEVGAMLVGRIVNHETGRGEVLRGEEKGYFEYGGSTVILLVPPGSFVPIDKWMGEEEQPVRMGEAVGRV